MAMAAAAHVGASQLAKAPSGMGGDYNGEILLLLISTGGVIFIDHARSGKPQSGNQYAALGIAGFALLFLGQFWPEVAFGFTLLIFISTLLNSPNGIPFVTNTGADTVPAIGANTAVSSDTTTTGQVKGDTNSIGNPNVGGATTRPQ